MGWEEDPTWRRVVRKLIPWRRSNAWEGCQATLAEKGGCKLLERSCCWWECSRDSSATKTDMTKAKAQKRKTTDTKKQKESNGKKEKKKRLVNYFYIINLNNYWNNVEGNIIQLTGMEPQTRIQATDQGTKLLCIQNIFSVNKHCVHMPSKFMLCKTVT